MRHSRSVLNIYSAKKVLSHPIVSTFLADGGKLWDYDYLTWKESQFHTLLRERQHCREHMISTNETWTWQGSKPKVTIWSWIASNGPYHSCRSFSARRNIFSKNCDRSNCLETSEGTRRIQFNLLHLYSTLCEGNRHSNRSFRLFRILDIRAEIRMIQIGFFLGINFQQAVYSNVHEF